MSSSNGPDPRFEATLQLPGTPSQYAATIGIQGQTTDLHLPARLLGDYELLEELARGAMGVVYRARQISLNRIVALKMILAGRFASALDVQRFHQEAEAAGNLDHPNILPIYDVGEFEGHQFFSMKLAEGGSLAQRMARLREHPQQAIRMIEQIARGIHHAHKRGILHRDLKPANVLLAESLSSDLLPATPLITDFGLAKRTQGDSSLTQSGAIVGTPSYMSPEQARGSKIITTAADIYSLGAILYEILAGTPPFRGESVAQTLRMVEEQEPASPRSLNPLADVDLEAIALKCLEKDPARRYESAGGFADDLAAWLRGEPVSARRAGWSRRMRKWVRRNPTIAALTAAIVLLLIAGSTISGILAVSARKQSAQAAANEREARDQQFLAQDRGKILQDTLCVATLERARAERMAGRPGWRQRSLDLVQQAASMRSERDSNESSVNLPDLADLRSEAIMALIADDASEVREIPLNMTSAAHISLDGRRLVQVGFNTDGGSFSTTVRTTDLRTNQEIHKATIPLDAKQPNLLINFTQMAALNFEGTRALCRNPINGTELTVHELPSGKNLMTLSDANAKTLPRTISRVRYSRDGTKVLAVRTATEDKSEKSELVVWDLARPDSPYILDRRSSKKSNGFMLGLLDIDVGEFSCTRFSFDSKRICFLSADRKTIHIRDLSVNPPAKLPDIAVPGHLITLDWHPVKPELAMLAASDGDHQHPSLILWDLNQGKARLTRGWDFPLDSDIGFASLAFSPDGRSLAAGGGQYTTVHVFGADDLIERFHLLDTALLGVARVFWTQAGELVVSSVMESLKFFKPVSEAFAENVSTIKPHGEPAFSADGRWLAFFAPDVYLNSSSLLANLFDEDADKSSLHERIALVDRQSGQVVRYFEGLNDRIVQLRFSPDSKRLVASTKTKIVGYDLLTGVASIHRELDKGRGLQFWDSVFYLPDGRLAAIGNYLPQKNNGHSSLVLWDVMESKGIRKLDSGGKGRVLTQRNVSPDGTRLFLTQRFPLGGPNMTGEKSDRFDRTVELPSGKILSETKRPERDPNQMEDVAVMSPNGERILALNMFVSGEEASFRKAFWTVRSAQGGEPLLKITNRSFTEHGNSFSRDGRLLAIAAERGNVEVWDIDNRRLLFRWQPHGGKSVEYLSFSPEGDIATSALGDSRIRLLKMDKIRERLSRVGLGW